MNTETQKINQVTDFVIDEVKENSLKKVTKNVFKVFGWLIDASVEHAAIEEANKPKEAYTSLNKVYHWDERNYININGVDKCGNKV